MPGIHEFGGDALEEADLLIVLAGLQKLQGGLGILHRVQRLHRIDARTGKLQALPLGVGFLDAGGIHEHDPQQVAGQAGGDDGPLKAVFHQQGQTAAVVDVGVGDQNAVDLPGGEGQGVVLQLVAPLLKAAVDEQLLPPGFQHMAGAGDFLVGAVESQFHGIPSFLSFV